MAWQKLGFSLLPWFLPLLCQGLFIKPVYGRSIDVDISNTFCSAQHFANRLLAVYSHARVTIGVR